jgi:glycogen debranching enzyme
MKASDYLELLQDHIDITRVPFSDRGSRILLFSYPERSALFVKLAERLTNLDPGIEAYLHRAPYIQNLQLIDAEGRSLDFTTSVNPHTLTLLSEEGEVRVVFQDEHTLAFGLPANVTVGLRFRVFPQHWRSTNTGGQLLAVRNLVYRTNGDLVRNAITPLEGGYEVELIVRAARQTTITLGIHPNPVAEQPVRPFKELAAEARARWLAWFARVPEVDAKYVPTYAYAWWVMANNLISPLGNVMYEAMSPSKIGYVGLWLWDSALHALAYRHVDPELSRNQIRAMLAHQLPNGMLPDAIYDDGIVTTIDHPISGEVTKPPILAWAVLKLHESAPDLAFLREVYPALVRLNGWWVSMNDDDDDGLVQYNHPYSSGLDDSPLWDAGMPVESPDLNTYLCVQMGSLAVIAETLGYHNEGTMWRRRSAALVARMIEHFWDEQAGLFWVIKEHQPLKVVTPFNLYPLWTGQLPDAMREKLLAHLRNPALFFGRYMLPTVARSDPRYAPSTMWRGPVWANINYFFIEALRQVGEVEMANQLSERTLEMIMAHKGIYEFYNAETGEPPATAVSTFGWTAAVFIDLAIQASSDQSLSNPVPGGKALGTRH